jgi:hypothetical protein
MGFILIMVFFNIEKDDDLTNLIRTNKVMYTKNLHQAWDPKHEKHSLLKATWFKDIQVIISYHELGMICDQYIYKQNHLIFVEILGLHVFYKNKYLFAWSFVTPPRNFW